MSYKIQITVNKQLNKMIQARAKQTGLSVSSYARLVLISALSLKNNKLLDQAIKDVSSSNVEALTLAEFNHQINNL